MLDSKRWRKASHRRGDEVALAHRPLAEALYALARRDPSLVSPLEDANLSGWLRGYVPATTAGVAFLHDGQALRHRDGLRPWILLPFPSVMLRLVTFAIVGDGDETHAQYSVVLQRDLRSLVINVPEGSPPKLSLLALNGMALISNDLSIEPLHVECIDGLNEETARRFFLGEGGSQPDMLRSLIRSLPLYIRKLAE